MLLDQETSLVQFLVFQSETFLMIDLFQLEFAQTLNIKKKINDESPLNDVTYTGGTACLRFQFTQVESSESEFFFGLIEILYDRFLEKTEVPICLSL